MFHYINSENLTYLALSDSTFKTSIAFAFLRDIKKKFLDKYSLDKIEKANAYGMKRFDRQLKSGMEYYNSPQADKMK